MTDVSVVIPTRDRPHWLARSLRAACSQEGVEFEVIVVHDGPDSGGLAPARKSGDRRVRTLELESPAGMAAARNAGTAAASGEWVAFLDDDDLWSRSKLRDQLDAAGDEAGFVYSGAVSIDDVGRVIASQPPIERTDLHSALLRWNEIPAGSSNVMVRRSALVALGGFDPGFTHLADWDAWIRISAEVSAVAHDSITVAYIQHAQANSLRPKAEFEREFDLLQEKHARAAGERGVCFDRPAFLSWLANRQLHAGRRRAAASLLLEAARLERRPLGVIRSGRALVGATSRRRRQPATAEWITAALRRPAK